MQVLVALPVAGVAAEPVARVHVLARLTREVEHGRTQIASSRTRHDRRVRIVLRLNHVRQTTTETRIHIALLVVANELDVVSRAQLHTVQLQRFLAIHHSLVDESTLIHRVARQTEQLGHSERNRRVQLGRVIAEGEAQQQRLLQIDVHRLEGHRERRARLRAHRETDRLLLRARRRRSRNNVEAVRRRHELHQRERHLLLVVRNEARRQTLAHRLRRQHRVHRHLNRLHLAEHRGLL